MSSLKLVVAFSALFLMLSVIWWPTFGNLGDLFLYAEKADYKGVSLLQFFYAELTILVVVWLYLFSYKNTKTPLLGEQYVTKLFLLTLLIIGQVFTGFFAGGFLVHQDAVWYKVIHEANDIMPSQAVILLVCYPMYLFFGGSAFIYTKTRMPGFLKNKTIAFMVLTFAPLAFLPYYDSSLMDGSTSGLEIVYVLAYWLLSIGWAVIGVMFLIFKASQEILRGLKDPYGEI